MGTGNFFGKWYFNSLRRILFLYCAIEGIIFHANIYLRNPSTLFPCLLWLITNLVDVPRKMNPDNIKSTEFVHCPKLHYPPPTPTSLCFMTQDTCLVWRHFIRWQLFHVNSHQDVMLGSGVFFALPRCLYSLLSYCQAHPQLQLKLSLLGWDSFNLAKSKTHPPPTLE